MIYYRLGLHNVASVYQSKGCAKFKQVNAYSARYKRGENTKWLSVLVVLFSPRLFSVNG